MHVPLTCLASCVPHRSQPRGAKGIRRLWDDRCATEANINDHCTLYPLCF